MTHEAISTKSRPLTLKLPGTRMSQVPAVESLLCRGLSTLAPAIAGWTA
ncbi:MAG TPA: hypothetical protein VNH11_03360 [Pirellulales bacterium]|nr:hypothetical protein [Pirellulales bacterium]